MSFKPKVTANKIKDKPKAEILQALMDKVPEQLWQDAYMDILVFGHVLPETQKKIEKKLLSES